MMVAMKNYNYSILPIMSVFIRIIGIIGFLLLYNNAKADNRYWKLYYNMEENVIDSNYYLASCYYDTIYNNYEFVYANHTLIGLQVAVLNNDTNKLKKYIEKCYIQGIRKEIVMNNLFIYKYIDLINTFKINYDSLRNIYKKRINYEIKNKVYALDSIDNIVTDKVNNSFLYFFKWRKTIKNISKQLFDIIEKYGYPDEKIIGIFDYGSSTENAIHAFKANNILVHYFSYFSFGIKRKNKLLLDEVYNGNLRPSFFGVFNDFQSRWILKNKTKQKYYNMWHFDPYKRIAEIDIRRSEIGLKNTKYEVKRRNYIIKCRKNKNNTSIKINFY